jgi:enoyl-CoA hydratase/carnithine racemase
MSTVRFTEDGALGALTLDSPPLNLIGEAMIGDLVAAVDQVEATDGLRALLLRGEGKAFSAGADVNLFAGKGSAEMLPLIASFLELGRRIEALRFPAIAAVHGTCMAGGFELALFCDLIWAAEGTMLGLPETRLGIVPLAGGVERIAPRAGLTSAPGSQSEAISTRPTYSRPGAVIDRVLPTDELHDSAEAFARTRANGPTLAFGVVKQLAHAYLQDGVPGADALLLDAAVSLFDTDDAHRGIESFLATGAPTASYEGH